MLLVCRRRAAIPAPPPSSRGGELVDHKSRGPLSALRRRAVLELWSVRCPKAGVGNHARCKSIRDRGGAGRSVAGRGGVLDPKPAVSRPVRVRTGRLVGRAGGLGRAKCPPLGGRRVRVHGVWGLGCAREESLLASDPERTGRRCSPGDCVSGGWGVFFLRQGG